MKNGVKTLLLFTLCLLIPLCACAQGLVLAQPMSGSGTIPEGADEAQASYLYRYEYPQFEALTVADQAINAYYQAMSQDVGSSLLAQNAEQLQGARQEGMPPNFSEISYQVTANDDHYVSVVLTARRTTGNAESEAISADTFARDGLYAGTPLTLSQVLGLEQEGDELSSKESVAEGLAYRLVWEILAADLTNIDSDYLDGLSEVGLRTAFSPESDFYLDENGNVVFFIQAGVIAGEVAGILTFPFAPAELLSAVKHD
ncbi:MAG: hypothetical protein RR946_00700 [Clostridia bacterium]